MTEQAQGENTHCSTTGRRYGWMGKAGHTEAQGAALPETEVRFAAASSGTTADKLWEDLDFPQGLCMRASPRDHRVPVRVQEACKAGGVCVGQATLKQELASALAQSSTAVPL